MKSEFCGLNYERFRALQISRLPFFGTLCISTELSVKTDPLKFKLTTAYCSNLTALTPVMFNMRKLRHNSQVFHAVLSREYKTLCSYPTISSIRAVKVLQPADLTVSLALVVK